MVEVTFTAHQPWALLPDKPVLDHAPSRQERDLYARHFRHRRIARVESECPPWRMGQELGWLIRSPVSVRIEPLDDLDLGVRDDEDLAVAAKRYGRTEAWKRDGAWIATSGGSWMQLYDYETERGWESMFLPNGAGTVEWRLGWSAAIPSGYFVLVLGEGPDGLECPTGVLAAKTANSMADRGGISLAIRPAARVVVRRGQVVARLVLLHADSLQARAAQEGV